MWLRLPIVPGGARQGCPHIPLARNGHKHTELGHPLPDFSLQNTCKFAVRSALWTTASDTGAMKKDVRGRTHFFPSSSLESLDHGVGHPHSLGGPNLAKADFSAKESQRRQKCPQNQSVMPTYTRTDPVGSRKVRTVHRQRSFECPGGVNLDKSAVELRQIRSHMGKANFWYTLNSVEEPSVSRWPHFGASLG